MAGGPAVDFEYDVFLSHNQAQKEWTRLLARRLRDDGFKVWFDEWELPKHAGSNWGDLLAQFAETSRKVILVWSPEFFQHEWPQLEAVVMQQTDPIGRKHRIIPVLVKKTDIPLQWSFREALDFQSCDHGTIDFEFRYQQLLYNIDNTRAFEGDFQRFREKYGDAVRLTDEAFSQASLAKRLLLRYRNIGTAAQKRRKLFFTAVPLLVIGSVLATIRIFLTHSKLFQRLAGFWSRLPQRSGRAILYIVIALLTLGWEMRATFFGEESDSRAGISLPGKLYQWFATAGHRKPRPHFVRIIVLSGAQGPFEIFADACKKREFVAALLDRISSASPSAAILDFWYSPHSCPSEDGVKQSAKLQAAIQRAADRFPVIIGSSTHTKREFDRESDPDLAKLIAAGLKDTDLVLDDRYSFVGKHLTYGLLRIDPDTRQIPIFWPVYEDKSAVIHHLAPRNQPSLAYEAATLQDPRVAPLLHDINLNNIHPLTTLIPETEFQPIHAIDLLCTNFTPSDDWRRCKHPDPLSSTILTSLSHKIVIISQRDIRSDFLDSVVGKVPGYVLQANYIESLLDDRYLRPIPLYWEFIWTLVGTVLVLAMFELTRKPLIALLQALILVALSAAGCNLLAIYLGRLIVFWFPLAAIVIIEFGVTLRIIFAKARRYNPRASQSNGATANQAKASGA